jgi:Tfp pilus assembly protein PilF
LYLKARRLVAQRGRGILEGRLLLERATLLDPDFAPAFAVLGDALRQQAACGPGDHHEAVSRAKLALARALQLDPENGEALGTRGSIALLNDRDATGAFADWERALTINPMLSTIRVFYAGYGLGIVRGDDARAVAEAERAAADDPASPVVASFRAVILALVGESAAAIAEGTRAVALDPEALLGRLCLAMTYQFCGEPALALQEARSALGMSGRAPHLLAMMSALYAATGEAERAAQAHREMLARSALDVVDSRPSGSAPRTRPSRTRSVPSRSSRPIRSGCFDARGPKRCTAIRRIRSSGVAWGCRHGRARRAGRRSRCRRPRAYHTRHTSIPPAICPTSTLATRVRVTRSMTSTAPGSEPTPSHETNT